MYIDELPKSCWECPCFKNNLEFPCGLSDGTQDYFKDEIDGENCPLKSIKTHDRELVRQVCEKIEDWCNKNFNWVGDGTGYDGQDYNEMIGSNNTINKLRGFLNQIQKDFEDGE